MSACFWLSLCISRTRRSPVPSTSYIAVHHCVHFSFSLTLISYEKRQHQTSSLSPQKFPIFRSEVKESVLIYRSISTIRRDIDEFHRCSKPSCLSNTSIPYKREIQGKVNTDICNFVVRINIILKQFGKSCFVPAFPACFLVSHLYEAALYLQHIQ